MTQRPHPHWHVGVVIPACDEAETIERCVRAARIALHAARPRSGRIVVVCDSCNDDTAALAQHALQGDGEVITCATRSAGAARKLGTSRLITRFEDDAVASLWIANTDADTFVRPDWIERQLEYADRDCGAVAGIVAIDGSGPQTPGLLRAFLRDYPIHADGTHPHVHGANIGFRADAYLAAGGWRDQALAEDHCLWQRLRTHWPCASAASIVVDTSGRLEGRAAGGFADTLRQRLQASCG